MLVKTASLKCNNNKLDSSTTTIIMYSCKNPGWLHRKMERKRWAYETLVYYWESEAHEKKKSCNKESQRPVRAVYCQKIARDTMSQVPYVLTKILVTSQKPRLYYFEPGGNAGSTTCYSISNSKNLQTINTCLL